MPLLANFTAAALSLLSSSSSHRYEPVRSPADPPPVPAVTIGVDLHGRAVEMPLVGAGTWQYNDTVAYESVCKAFRAGYTFVDTAYGYGNQVGVGRAIRDCWTTGAGGLRRRRREELFVMTKVPGGLKAEEVLDAHQSNLDQLGLDYVDHVMTHFPSDWDVTPERSSPAMRREEWLALEELYHRGLTRSIGMSHYCPRHIDDVLSVATVQPSINQVEYHVGSGDVDGVMDKCRMSNITFMSFSPLCGPCTYDPRDSLISGDLVTDIGKKHGVSGSQVSLRFIVQQALVGGSYVGGVIPKSDNPVHIASNRDLFSFELDEEDMGRLREARKPEAEGGDCDVP